MLRPAAPEDAGFVQALWTAPEHARLIDPPQDGVIGQGIAAGDVLIWQPGPAPAGFALLQEWVPDVWSIMTIAVTRPGQGRPFLAAVLHEVFARRGAHRIGLDVTVDNLRARRFFAAAGFVQEGLWREGWRRPGGDWVDCAFMGLLRRDWRG